MKAVEPRDEYDQNNVKLTERLIQLKHSGFETVRPIRPKIKRLYQGSQN